MRVRLFIKYRTRISENSKVVECKISIQNKYE